MARPLELTGRTFGLLEVTGPVTKQGKRRVWLCSCKCGRTKNINQDNLVQGRSNSCGCQRDAQSSRSIQKLVGVGAKASVTHGLAKTRTYVAWQHAKQRCFNPSNAKYPKYGGRGITMCDRWKDSFENFLEDMGECPEGLTLERRDVHGNYDPDNCWWETKTAQARNKTSNRVLTLNGRSALLVDWAREFGIPKNKLHYQLQTRGSLEAVVKEFGYAYL